MMDGSDSEPCTELDRGLRLEDLLQSSYVDTRCTAVATSMATATRAVRATWKQQPLSKVEECGEEVSTENNGGQTPSAIRAAARAEVAQLAVVVSEDEPPPPPGPTAPIKKTHTSTLWSLGVATSASAVRQAARLEAATRADAVDAPGTIKQGASRCWSPRFSKSASAARAATRAAKAREREDSERLLAEEREREHLRHRRCVSSALREAGRLRAAEAAKTKAKLSRGYAQLARPDSLPSKDREGTPMRQLETRAEQSLPDPASPLCQDPAADTGTKDEQRAKPSRDALEEEHKFSAVLEAELKAVDNQRLRLAAQARTQTKPAHPASRRQISPWSTRRTLEACSRPLRGLDRACGAKLSDLGPAQPRLAMQSITTPGCSVRFYVGPDESLRLQSVHGVGTLMLSAIEGVAGPTIIDNQILCTSTDRCARLTHPQLLAPMQGHGCTYIFSCAESPALRLVPGTRAGSGAHDSLPPGFALRFALASPAEPSAPFAL